MIKRFFFMMVAMVVAVASQANEQWVDGVHYRTLPNALPTTYSGDQIGEIQEFFSYSCIHCFNFETPIAAFKASMPNNVKFTAIPVFFNERQAPEVKAFYAAQLLNVFDEAHMAIYNEIHVNRRPLRTDQAFAQFFERFNVSRDEYTKMISSFAVAGKVNQSAMLSRNSGITGTPSIMANGKYVINASAVGSNEKALEVALWLIQRDANVN